MTHEYAERLLEAIRSLPRGERLRLIERIVHELADEDVQAPVHSIVGLFADEPELIEAVCKAAMQARERDPLTQAGQAPP
jgi:hypothetical protein